MKQKNIVRLTESDLHRVIKESVKQIINEISPELAMKGYYASLNKDRELSPAMKRRFAKNPNAMRERDKNLSQGAQNAFNREYGDNLDNVPYGSGDSTNLRPKDMSKPVYGVSVDPHGVHAMAGNWSDKGPYYDGLMYNFHGFDGETNDNQRKDLSFGTKIKNPKMAHKVKKGNDFLNKNVGPKQQ